MHSVGGDLVENGVDPGLLGLFFGGEGDGYGAKRALIGGRVRMGETTGSGVPAVAIFTFEEGRHQVRRITDWGVTGEYEIDVSL